MSQLEQPKEYERSSTWQELKNFFTKIINGKDKEKDKNINSKDGAKTKKTSEKPEPTWPEYNKELNSSETEKNIRDLFIREGKNWEINAEKKELVTKLADSAEKYFDKNKNTLDEKKYKRAMMALWIFVNVQRKRAVKDNHLNFYIDIVDQ